MNTPLDNAITNAAAAEATYNSGTANVASIQTSITTATAPLAPAQAQLANDGAAFKTTLIELSAVALAQANLIPDAVAD